MILTDVKLPVMDGFTFFEQIKIQASLKDVPFVFITAYDNPAAIKKVKKLGAAYITKPYQLKSLLESIKKLLSSEKDKQW